MKTKILTACVISIPVLMVACNSGGGVKSSMATRIGDKATKKAETRIEEKIDGKVDDVITRILGNL